MKVFISYGKKDQTVAQKLYNDFKKAGVSTWIDKALCIKSRNIKLRA
jgi:hypothetical protein